MPVPDSPLPDWHRAHGKPLSPGIIKQEFSDFEVTEELGFELSDDGEHDFLWLEKSGANTQWVARQLARHAGVAPKDVGYAGLKDRHAVTRQWFSVRRPSGAGTDWKSIDIPGVSILDIGRNRRKLKRGSHAGNEFRIVVRGTDCSEAQIDERLSRISEQGAPNYFGPQRFGRNGANLTLARALFAGKRLSRDSRSIALSAARSFLFNEILSSRVADGTWNRPLTGDAFNLDRSNSYFVSEEIDRELEGRVAELDIHPTGPLWGKGDQDCFGETEQLEQRVAKNFAEITAGIEATGVAFSRRALRIAPRRLRRAGGNGEIVLTFQLGRGAFATSVLREIINFTYDY